MLPWKPQFARWRRLRGVTRRRRIASAAAMAVGLTAVSVAFGPDGTPDGAWRAASGQTASALAADVPAAALTSRDLTRGVDALQRRLKAQPGDAGGWAALGAAYVEQARTIGDPTRYPQAEKAFGRSLRLRGGDENDAALAGQAALAAARHDFTAALRLADRALEVNPYGERALSVRVDALVELGRYREARKAVELADRRRPGVPVFTRYAYVLELHGDVKGARRVLLRALDSAFSAGDKAYVATELGQLSWSRGDFRRALGHFDAALRAEPEYVPALEGRGRSRAALGDLKSAVRDLKEAVRRSPLPGRLAALAELYEAEGRQGAAKEQYALMNAWTRLARANGVAAEPESALVEAGHGDAAEALTAARDEWSRRHSVHTADALAWALHANGRYKEALGYAKKATAPEPGYQNASLLFHRGMIERALGEHTAARRHLRAALELNSGFSLTHARQAKAALGELAVRSGQSAGSAARGGS
ncbi:tetratricopeptide repeat protein [Streptomyces sp. NBC_01216]|uniref:tetratricopeptide repeat protein n=1 Tax=Streptomyces sp. NBC_01216 TaxID=2903778 RepID=UPI002E0F7027|nr:tetratricopeptide repeat protein [Streptomyces sp. NBC_01216]